MELFIWVSFPFKKTWILAFSINLCIKFLSSFGVSLVMVALFNFWLSCTVHTHTISNNWSCELKNDQKFRLWEMCWCHTAHNSCFPSNRHFNQCSWVSVCMSACMFEHVSNLNISKMMVVSILFIVSQFSSVQLRNSILHSSHENDPIKVRVEDRHTCKHINALSVVQLP